MFPIAGEDGQPDSEMGRRFCWQSLFKWILGDFFASNRVRGIGKHAVDRVIRARGLTFREGRFPKRLRERSSGLDSAHGLQVRCDPPTMEEGGRLTAFTSC